MIIKCIKSFRYAFQGLYLLLKTENNARIHLIASTLTVSLGLYVNLSQHEWLWIFLAIFSVWVTESFNTALEKMVDMISMEKSELAKNIKDVSAGAVLVSAIFSVLVGTLIFTPYVAKLLNFG